MGQSFIEVNFSFQGYLRPSRELLEFYRRKITQYDTERDEMIQKLDRCKVAYEEKVRYPAEEKKNLSCSYRTERFCLV